MNLEAYFHGARTSTSDRSPVFHGSDDTKQGPSGHGCPCSLVPRPRPRLHPGLEKLRLSLLALVLGLVGCATYDTDNPFDKMITRDTEMTQTGANDAVVDHHMENGTRVRILGMSGDGNLQIQTMSGDKGYVPASAVGDAPDTNGMHNQN